MTDSAGEHFIADLIAQRGSERYELATKYTNPVLTRTLHTIGFDKTYVRGEGALLFDDEGNDYLDMLAGFGVFQLGRHEPTVRQAIHDVIDLGLGDLTQFDAPPLAGLLAEQLLAKTRTLNASTSVTAVELEAVEGALKFARYATGRKRIVYCDHAFHGLTAGSLSVNGSAGFPRGIRSAAARCRDRLR